MKYTDSLFSGDQQVSCITSDKLGDLIIKIYHVEKEGHSIFSICHDGKNFIAFVRKAPHEKG